MRNARQRGFIMALGIFMIAILISTLAYLYEVGRLTTAKIMAQNAADAGAKTGALVFASYRNMMTTDHALMDLWRRVAENAAHYQGRFFWGALGGTAIKRRDGAYQQADEFPRDADRLGYVRDLRRLYHAAFRVQDAAVTRFFAAHQTKVHQFRQGVGIYNKQEVLREMRRMMKRVAYLNLFPPGVTNPDFFMLRNFYGGNEKAYPGFYLMGGYFPLGTVINAMIRGPDRNGRNPQPDQYNYAQEASIDSMGRAYVRIRAQLSSGFQRFLPLNWFGNHINVNPLPFGGSCGDSVETSLYLSFRGIWQPRWGFTMRPIINPKARYFLPVLLLMRGNIVCADAAAGVRPIDGGFLPLSWIQLDANTRYFGMGLPFAGGPEDRFPPQFPSRNQGARGSMMRWDLWFGWPSNPGRLFLFVGNPEVKDLTWYHAEYIPTLPVANGPEAQYEPYH